MPKKILRAVFFVALLACMLSGASVLYTPPAAAAFCAPICTTGFCPPGQVPVIWVGLCPAGLPPCNNVCIG